MFSEFCFYSFPPPPMDFSSFFLREIEMCVVNVGLFLLQRSIMDKDGKSQRGCRGSEPDFLLRWGNRKRLRCVKVKDRRNVAEKSDCLGSKKITSRVDRRVVTAEKEAPSTQTQRLNR